MIGTSLQKVSLKRFFILQVFYACFQGFVHPIILTKFKNLFFPDYIFGLASAATAIGMFIFSPLWGRWGIELAIQNYFQLHSRYTPYPN